MNINTRTLQKIANGETKIRDKEARTLARELLKLRRAQTYIINIPPIQLTQEQEQEGEEIIQTHLSKPR